MSSTILVTGASGLLGANLVLCAQQRYENVLACCYPESLQFPAGVRVANLDLADTNKARNIISDYQPSWIIHCAALTNVDWCENHPNETWQINVEVSRKLAILAHEVGAGFVYISTDSVFDGKTGCYGEDSTPAPLNVYAKSKLSGEQAVIECVHHCLILRTNIYGWNALDKTSLAEWILSRLESGQTVPAFRDVVFAPILVNDLSEAILDMMNLGLNGTYHVAGSQSCSKYEFALQIADVFDSDKRLIQSKEVASSALIAPRPANTSLLTAKVARALGRQMPAITVGLQRFRSLRDSGYVARLKAMKGG